MSNVISFADDLLCGAEQIAIFLYGDRFKRRKIYYLHEAGLIPTFELGGICARKSTLLDWIAQQENMAISITKATNSEAA